MNLDATIRHMRQRVAERYAKREISFERSFVLLQRIGQFENKNRWFVTEDAELDIIELESAIEVEI